MYSRTVSEQITNPSQSNQEAANNSFSEMALKCEEVGLLGSPELRSLCIDHWNDTSKIPKLYTIPADDDYKKKLKAYRKSRHLVSDQAKREVHELELASL